MERFEYPTQREVASFTFVGETGPELQDLSALEFTSKTFTFDSSQWTLPNMNVLSKYTAKKKKQEENDD